MRPTHLEGAEEVSGYKLCSKCGRIFINYEKPDECVNCGSSEFVGPVDQANANGYRHGVDLRRGKGDSPGTRAAAPRHKAPKP